MNELNSSHETDLTTQRISTLRRGLIPNPTQQLVQLEDPTPFLRIQPTYIVLQSARPNWGLSNTVISAQFSTCNTPKFAGRLAELNIQQRGKWIFSIWRRSDILKHRSATFSLSLMTSMMAGYFVCCTYQFLRSNESSDCESGVKRENTLGHRIARISRPYK